MSGRRGEKGTRRFIDPEDRRRSNLTLPLAAPFVGLVCWATFLLHPEKAGNWPLIPFGALLLTISAARHRWLKNKGYAAGLNAFQYHYVAQEDEYHSIHRPYRGKHRESGGREEGWA